MTRFISLVFFALLAACGPTNLQVRQAVDRNDVINVADRLFICTDNRDWTCVRDAFAPEVLFDMTSLGAARVEKKTPQQIAETWNEGLKAVKAVHHQSGNYQVTIRDNEAYLFCYGISYHYLPNPTNRNTRVFVGSYDFHLVKGDKGWKIDRFKFNLKFIDGNKDLEKPAKKRAI